MEDKFDLYLPMQCCGEWPREFKVSCVYMFSKRRKAV